MEIVGELPLFSFDLWQDEYYAPNPAPILGSVQGGILYLNSGRNADKREFFNTEDGNEVFTLYTDKSGKVGVEFAGYYKVFEEEITKVFAYGGEGNDTFDASRLKDVELEIYGESGDDTIIAGTGKATLYGDSNNDLIDARLSSSAIIHGGSGSDILKGSQTGKNFIRGNEDQDTIYGGSVDDEIYGDGGVDTIYGRSGNDTISGGAENDLIYGEGGADSISGDGGNDTIYGGVGDDIIRGGGDTDYIYGERGNDTIHGGNNTDYIYGGLGDDKLYGDAGDDEILGEQGNDILDGGANSDTLDGGLGNDTVSGGDGDDTLTSNYGNDNLDGQNGTDKYLITFFGDYVNRTVNAYDTGNIGTDHITLTGVQDVGGNYLLRASDQRAFIVLFNQDTNLERMNYKQIEEITIDAGAGDDSFTSDDTTAKVTINAGAGDDTFQIGQIFKSRRDANAGIAAEDIFATDATTRGFLSRGNSQEMTINGGSGDDTFTVFRNLAVLNLNGDDDDDLFILRSFASENSKTNDVSSGKGRDTVEYIGNAPVKINGGDGNDTVRIIGTEFADQFIVTADAVFGAGRITTYTEIENLQIDAAEGDDEFYVLSTNSLVTSKDGSVTSGFVTSLFGGLGSDYFSLGGDTASGIDVGLVTLEQLVPFNLSGTISDNGKNVIISAKPGSHTVDHIQGELIIDGFGGEGSAGGLTAPVMLSGETNLMKSSGQVLGYRNVNNQEILTVKTSDLNNALPNLKLSDLKELIKKTVEISRGNGLGRFWQITDLITDGDTTQLILLSPTQPADEWGLPDANSEYAITSLSSNFFVNEDTTQDYITLFEDGDQTNNIGQLSSNKITGLGLGDKGITYGNFEIVEMLLGQGDDQLTITNTADGAITSVHGGAGSDTIKAMDRGGSDYRGLEASLVIFGDTTEDGTRYSGDPSEMTPRFAKSFSNYGNDILDASALTEIVSIYGGKGNDTIKGGQAGDHLAGGAGNDTILGNGGNDHIYGDSGFNLDVDTRNLTVPTTEIAGEDYLDGGSGEDIIFGDHGIIDQTPETSRILTTANITQVKTNQFSNGAKDQILGGSENDLILGGAMGDSLYGNEGEDAIIGDHAFIYYNNDHLIGRITTIAPNRGGDDVIEGNSGDDILIGGFGSDNITGAAGQDIALGDNGVVVRNDGSADANDIFTQNPNNGGSDTIAGGLDDDIILGGAAGDNLTGNEANDIVIGDNGRIYRNSSDTVERITTIAPSWGGDDVIEGNDGDDILIGGFGSDNITGAAGQDIALGDNGVVVRNDGSADANDIFTQNPNTGGSDTIAGGLDDDIILGGAAGDNLTGNEANDIVIGDNGRIYRNSSDTMERITTIAPSWGGDDVIEGNNGDDILIGGFGSDNITGAAGQDIALGDNGFLNYSITGNLNTLNLVSTSNPTLGDRDDIDTGADNDLAFGGTLGDNIIAGAGNDLVFGDHGKVEGTIDLSALPLNQAEPPFTFTAIDTQESHLGGDEFIDGGDGDDILLGQQGNDTLLGGADDDDLIGGHNVVGGHDGNDTLDGGSGNDVVAGDNAVILRQPDTYNDRMRVLSGEEIYDSQGNPLVTSDRQKNPLGIDERKVELLDHSINTSTQNFGNDFIAGGADHDVIFGQLGDDTIQGDSSVNDSVSVDLSDRDRVDPSTPHFTDGDDYIEGGGGNDLIFGNLGQDDIIGGSSTFFGNNTPEERPDGEDIIFGGAGTDLEQNTLGDLSAEGHAQDADVILGDNGNIYRLVGTNGVSSSDFLTFTYDHYSDSLTIIPRAIELVDYTAGESNSNVGGDDLIHGEAGDDLIHGMSGNDVLFGEGQDDDIYGGTGHDRIYGGSGIDGIISDDGLILTSRNGNTETLYGLFEANQARTIRLPGPFTRTQVYVTGELQKDAVMHAFDKGGNDVIYGGLGGDFIHAGAGDDAVSGAEALSEFYISAPVTNTNLLAYDPTTGKFADYDANNPFAYRNGFLLNFLSSDSTGTKINDGQDVIFGDLGNDWLVGGTESDRLFGGQGDDLLNADDNLMTNNGLNNRPDDPEYADGDYAFGGAGRDILIANTGNDRLFDWVGEFNTFLVPFSAFGNPTVVRSPSPHVIKFLMELGTASGADQNLAEPNGELGLVDQQDDQWQDQSGAPRDPQAGNTPGVQRDTTGQSTGTSSPEKPQNTKTVSSNEANLTNSTNALFDDLVDDIMPEPLVSQGNVKGKKK